MRGYLIVVFALSALGSALTLPAANPPEPHAPKQPFEATSTEQVNFSAGGTVRVVNSYGYLTVEGWDEPEVQVNVIKSTNRFCDPGEKQEAERRFALVRVVTERRSDKELLISTVLPPRNPIFRSVLPLDRIVVTKPLVPNNKRGVTVEYRILVPRESRLVVRHDTGYVCVNGERRHRCAHPHRRHDRDAAGQRSVPGGRANQAGQRFFGRRGQGPIPLRWRHSLRLRQSVWDAARLSAHGLWKHRDQECLPVRSILEGLRLRR